MVKKKKNLDLKIKQNLYMAVEKSSFVVLGILYNSIKNYYCHIKLAREEADFNTFKNKLNIYWKLITKLHCRTIRLVIMLARIKNKSKLYFVCLCGGRQTNGCLLGL